MASLRDVARHAGVSTATVSRVLNKSDKVILKTRAKVENSMRLLGYRPSRVARRLRIRGGRAHMLGLIIPDILNPFFTEIARGVEDVAYANQYALILCNSDESISKESFYLDVMRSELVDGIILPPITETDSAVTEFVKSGLPIVCVDRSLSGVNMDVVDVDNYKGAFEAVEYLIQLGHKRIAMISGRPNVSTSSERLRGYEEALRAYKIPVAKELIRIGDYKQERGRILASQLITLPKPPTALFVANNLMVVGALSAIHQHNLRIPEDVAVIGFDDLPWADTLDPPLTVVQQPAYEVGRRAAELLLQRLAEPTRPPVLVRLSPKLIKRHSC